ncbi:MAG TPA: F0F1 ATP synthase subunit A [Candidatus Ozemobacteraceae bacterium]|nr:F0F1 ATP synthase subunit A [Candidatus Ozemobacteraceae bacterium]
MIHGPDAIVFWQSGFVTINLTLVATWGIMLLLILVSKLVTRRLTTGPKASWWQNLLETIVELLRGQLREIGFSEPDRHLPFLGTLFLFIATANLLIVLPFYEPPTASFSTTAALALCVFVFTPVCTIAQKGLRGWLAALCHPNPLLAPLHIMGDISRTIALAIRLFGNVMSENLVGGLLLSLAPFFVPVVMKLFGLLTGFVQACIFSLLAAVFLAAATSETPSNEAGERN